MAKQKHKGGEFFQGDYGCVVYPGLTVNTNPKEVVTKVFKNPIEKLREEHVINDILSHFPNDFIVKKIDDSIDVSKNPEINGCELTSGKITPDYIKKNSLSYVYLGKTLDKIIPKDINELKIYLKSLLDLSFKVIYMNSKGYSHGDIASRNISFKDNKAYLIDIGAFEYKPGTTNYTDVSDLLKIISSIPNLKTVVTDEDDLILLKSYSIITYKNIEQIKQLLVNITKFVSKGGGKTRRLKRRKTHRRRK